jgi:hypothetical protein
VGATLGVIAIVAVAIVLWLLSHKRSRGDSLNHYSDEMETVDGNLDIDPEAMSFPTTSPVITATNPEDVDLQGFTFFADEGVGVD